MSLFTTFKKVDGILHIHAHIYVERATQRAILIGSKGRSLKHVGRRARKEMERFFKERIFLQTKVEVIRNWEALSEGGSSYVSSVGS